MNVDTLRRYIQETILVLEDEINEFSGVGAIAGMTLPLGMSPGIPPTPYVKRSKGKKRQKRKKR